MASVVDDKSNVVDDPVARYWQGALATSAQLAFVMDASRRIVAVSDGLARACDATRHELVGHRCYELMHGREAHEHCPAHELLLDGGVHEGVVDSEVLDKEFSVSVTPLPDASGRVTHILHVAIDITERERMACALRAGEEEVRRQAERLSQMVAGTVQAMGQLVESRDPYTAVHQRRVAELAAMVGEELEWAPDRVEGLRTAALVHDVGKIAVPAEILSKPGRLTEYEYLLIQGHVQRGYEILSPVDFEVPVAAAVQQHHERVDGSGYPLGLRGDEILPEARVLAVADVAEAMLTHRPYRAALPVDDVIAEVRSGQGSRYDREAGAACLRLLEDGFSFTER